MSDEVELKQVMVKACLSAKTLARKSGLPLSTIRKAMRGDTLSPTLYDSLVAECLEEINANTRRASEGQRAR
jgi:predicted transcriptional regulator